MNNDEIIKKWYPEDKKLKAIGEDWLVVSPLDLPLMLNEAREDEKNRIREFDKNFNQSIHHARQAQRAEFKKLLKRVSIENPYPEKLFPEPTEKELKKAVEAIISSGTTSDRIHGSWGRKVWEMALERVLVDMKQDEGMDYIQANIEASEELLSKLNE